VERLGMERTHRELERADLMLAVFDAGSGPAMLETLPTEVTRIDVYNKVDLLPGFQPPAGAHRAVGVSAKTGEGIDALRKAILEAAGWVATGESVFLARERHLRALEAARRHLAVADSELRRWELFAEELRLAQVALGGISGEVTADDLLGEIFARFCVGK
jgi:tRNA modification GTPase